MRKVTAIVAGGGRGGGKGGGTGGVDRREMDTIGGGKSTLVTG